jgi:hypothetical protein
MILVIGLCTTCHQGMFLLRRMILVIGLCTTCDQEIFLLRRMIHVLGLFNNWYQEKVFIEANDPCDRFVHDL